MADLDHPSASGGRDVLEDVAGPAGNAILSANLSALFASSDLSDCTIQFVDERGGWPKALGDPLPAHSLVLKSASGWFREQADSARRLGARRGILRFAWPLMLTGGSGGRRTLRVPLGSPEQLPAALAALRFAYTGQLSARSIVEALEVWRQADYLQVEGGPEACHRFIRERLPGFKPHAQLPRRLASDDSCDWARGSDGSSCGFGGSAGGASEAWSRTSRGTLSSRSTSGAASPKEGAGAAGGVGWPAAAGAGPSSSAALFSGLCGSDALWGALQAEPRSPAALGFARQQLLAIFGDAVAALNTPRLRRQLLALPAPALELLLEGEEFGTDCEDTVLLLLATWMLGSAGRRADAAARERLCRQVRLVQLSLPYLHAVLSALAADYEASQGGSCGGGDGGSTAGDAAAAAASAAAATDAAAAGAGSAQRGPSSSMEPGQRAPGCGCGWFPISPEGAVFVRTCAAARSPAERERLLRAAGGGDDCAKSPWFSTVPRRQAVPPGGLTYGWHVCQAALEAALSDPAPPGGLVEVEGTFDGRDGGGADGGEGGDGGGVIAARGFEWRPSVRYRPGEEAAGVSLRCLIPAAYRVEGSRLGGGALAAARLEAQMRAPCWEGVPPTSHGWGELLPLQHSSPRTQTQPRQPRPALRRESSSPPAAPSDPQVEGEGEEGEEAACSPQLAPWWPYLEGGSIRAELTVLPPPARSGGAAGVLGAGGALGSSGTLPGQQGIYLAS
ncbi:hypothetical protein GPECTOR_112g262 [Gonium pectorale]|uniref:BACK domain-containing protein n=1 Tax=Gonium pectorale TaxID=33097 RepID=A0A150FZ63_GONPE|nr:hypothetical protein GPECTOR_112g262 [Gonium pectorale]|eukprot:KXZ42892.1 hypothetical protein GPECTOR_112g262 [Gonium pectorale]